jgi:predicted metal-dependent phosphoesterase TrpH
MMTMAHFDRDRACLVIDVFGHPLRYQLRFAADDLGEHTDDLIRRAVEVWRRCEETHTMTADDLALLQQAQTRLLDQVRRP